jgi:hypothetical protein
MQGHGTAKGGTTCNDRQQSVMYWEVYYSFTGTSVGNITVGRGFTVLQWGGGGTLFLEGFQGVGVFFFSLIF